MRGGGVPRFDALTVPPPVQANIRFPAKIDAKLREIAKARGTSLSALVNIAVREWLDTQTAENIKPEE